MNATVIIPTYQERGNIERIIREVLAQGDEFRVLVVDDGSPDGTADAAQALRPEFGERLEVACRDRKYGLGPAYIYGFAKALENGADRVFEMDADFSHPPRYLRDLLQASEEADLVIGSRYCPGGGVQNWPLSRRMISRLGNLYARAVLWCGVRDMTAGFKCYRREALEAMDIWTIRSTGYAFQVETTWRALRARVPGGGEAHHLRGAGGRRLQDVPENRVGSRPARVAVAPAAGGVSGRP